MKFEMMLMDALALELVIRCVKCQKAVRVNVGNWTDETLDRCSYCGDEWAEHQSIDTVRRTLVNLRDLLRMFGSPGTTSLPIHVQFGGSRKIREAA
jgi:hypothetical protein